MPIFTVSAACAVIEAAAIATIRIILFIISLSINWLSIYLLFSRMVACQRRQSTSPVYGTGNDENLNQLGEDSQFLTAI
jgi:hypothetical protein